ncbi:MAG: glycosyltransferase [Clostridia bacterium]|nr:glycosyltransferase [Clostridia bacterium]
MKESIRSVLDQTYHNFEFIIVDDGSSDNSVDIIKRYEKEDKRIHPILCAMNQGVSAARNKGIEKSRGEFIALIDNDDTWEPEKLERQLAIAIKDVDIVYCSYDFIDEHGEKIKKPFIVPPKANFHSMLTSSVISSSTAFIRADILEKNPFSSEYYHEDYVLWMKLLRKGATAEGERTVLMHYRQRPGSKSQNKGNSAKERWNTFRKALGLNLISSIWYFLCYSVKGVIKYYF